MKKIIFNTFLFCTGLTLSAYSQCDGQATFTDTRDSRVYNQVTIGTQCWMAENLNIGTRINSGGGGQMQTNNGIIEKYCYDDSEPNCTTDGGLYEWYEMMDYNASDVGNPGTTQGICPTGWHIPTDAEWCTMENTIEANTDVSCNATGGRGTSTGSIMKDNISWDGTNTSGFSALPVGVRSFTNGAFEVKGVQTFFWTASESGSTLGWVRILTNADPKSYRTNSTKTWGLSVRCVRNTAAWPLPIELLYFKARWTDESFATATLEWETISESQNSHFEIERSIDAINFEYVKSVEGAGNSIQNISYNALDETPYTNGTSYYRLKQVDDNGDYEYSNIEALNVPEGLNMINLFPNPMVDQLTLLLTSSEETKTTVSIRNHLGQEVRQFEQKVNKGFNSVEFNLSELSTGSYIIEVMTSSGLYKVERKFVKSNQ